MEIAKKKIKSIQGGVGVENGEEAKRRVERDGKVKE